MTAFTHLLGTQHIGTTLQLMTNMGPWQRSMDLNEDPDCVMDEPDTYNKHIGVQSVLDEETNIRGDLATVTK